VDEHVRYQVSGAVATVTLDRPAAMNALTVPMKLALAEALRTAAEDREVRAVVLTGTGRAFCAGQDLREHADSLAGGGTTMDTVRAHYNPVVSLITGMAKPVVAAVNGMAAGAGASLALACDFRLAAEDASFLMAFAQVGLSGDSGVSWFLPRLVGLGRATRLLMFAEPLGASVAAEWGLVDKVVPTEALAGHAVGFAARLANGPTVAYGAIKEALNYAAGHDLAQTLEKEAELQARCGATADHRGATEAFLSKRKAGFTGS
jgi:2-(1,2-epoxy-1,2-dihydrophenyl)acetyl-CoA isomerase